MDISSALRQHQQADPIMGALFMSLYTFVERTYEEFYSDTLHMPLPSIYIGEGEQGKLGFFTPIDGYCLPMRINLNAYLHKDGAQLAETLAHELVHLWQHHCDYPKDHDYLFVDRLLRMGIHCEPGTGKHLHYANYWAVWMAENEDLHLADFILPGAD